LARQAEVKVGKVKDKARLDKTSQGKTDKVRSKQPCSQIHNALAAEDLRVEVKVKVRVRVGVKVRVMRNP
jgi:hypothetical protein